jgi:hypothetical protein
MTVVRSFSSVKKNSEDNATCLPVPTANMYMILISLEQWSVCPELLI